MLNVLVVLVSVLIAVVALGLAALSQMAKRMRQATVELDKKLSRLEKRLDDQETAVGALRKSLDQQASDPVMEIIKAAQGWTNNGPWATVASIGSRIFRSYWGQKRRDRRALPVSSEAKK